MTSGRLHPSIPIDLDLAIKKREKNSSKPTNSADRHSLQFTINKIVYKIFGAMSKDLHIEISAHVGTESVENLVANRRNRFINRHGETDNIFMSNVALIGSFV